MVKYRVSQGVSITTYPNEAVIISLFIVGVWIFKTKNIAIAWPARPTV